MTGNKNLYNSWKDDCLTLRITNSCICYPATLSKTTAMHLSGQSVVRSAHTNEISRRRREVATNSTETETDSDNTAYNYTCDLLTSGQVTDTLACDHPASNSVHKATDCDHAASSRESSLDDIKNTAEYSSANNEQCVTINICMIQVTV